MRRCRMGNIVCAVMTAGLLGTPMLFFPSLSCDSPGADSAEDPETSRVSVRVVEVEGWATEGIRGLAEEMASLPEAPTWEAVRLAMERRGCSALRYGYTIRSVMSDGSLDERSWLRRPYAEPQHADEFLRYLRGGVDAAVWTGAGDPPWKVVSP